MLGKGQRIDSDPSVYSEAPVDLSSLQGKGALVTGGATGVGAALVRALADAGAYMTIADDNAIEGQRLMLELISNNKRVQYIYTRLPSFPSQTESFYHASTFAPTSHLPLVIANTIPPSSSSSSTADSLLSWLTTTPPTATTPSSPPPPPPTAPFDVGVTAALYTAHLAFHHFRAAAATPSSDDGDGDDDEHQKNGASAGRGGGGGGGGGHLLFLAPRAYVVDGGVAPDALAAGAAAAGFRSLVRGLRGVVTKKECGMADVRVNLVAVGGRGEKGEGEGEGEANGKEEKREEEKYGECVDAVMRIVCDGSASGRAVMVSRGEVRQGRI